MISVLVVDDSALIRDLLSTLLVADGDIRVVGTAHDPLDARDKIKMLNPDVVTLDIEMPNMNGLAFLEKIMRLRPTPVVMVSTLTTRGASETMLALELGAVDFVAKPGGDMAGSIARFGRAVRDKVRVAAATDVRTQAGRVAVADVPVISAAAPAGSLVAIGASTGGVEAVRQVLMRLPCDCPPVMIAQHMPKGFTTRFAQRLDEVVALDVVEAVDRMPLETGHVYVAPGDCHLRVERSSGFLKARIGQDEPVSGHRPSVDALFSSVARVVGPLGVGVILTGMGRDGASGLGEMRAAGAHTIGQNRESALIYGMPRVAFEEGAVIEEAPVEAIAGLIAAALRRGRRAA